MAHLTIHQRAAYAASGYVAPVEALSADEAAACRRQLEAALAATGGRADSALRNKPHLLWRWAADLVRDARIADAAEDLLGPDLLVLHSTLFVKAPHDQSQVAWHQDIAYWDLSSERAVTAWVALTDSCAANGCVQVVPGSHLEPLLPHRLGRDSANRLIHGQAVQQQVDSARVAALELRAGQVSLHHVRLLHGSRANRSATLRAGLAVRYIACDVRQGGPRQGATLVRGRDRYGYYDHEPAPRYDDDPIARAWHRRYVRRYAAVAAWQALRHPSLGHLVLLGRMAVRRDMLRTLLR